MAEQILLYLSALLAAALQIATPMLPDAVVSQLAEELLEQAGAVEQIEYAAFIVRSPAGALELLPWPDRGTHAARWIGAIPAAAVAVIHTHPRQRPTPSAQDRLEAIRLGLPFYVVSRGALCVAAITNSVLCAAQVPWLGSMAGKPLKWNERARGPR